MFCLFDTLPCEQNILLNRDVDVLKNSELIKAGACISVLLMKTF